ncbi:MAG: hypothetical protein WAX89_00385 [Alphaproteobacteria bacterium]
MKQPVTSRAGTRPLVAIVATLVVCAPLLVWLWLYCPCTQKGQDITAPAASLPAMNASAAEVAEMSAADQAALVALDQQLTQLEKMVENLNVTMQQSPAMAAEGLDVISQALAGMSTAVSQSAPAIQATAQSAAQALAVAQEKFPALQQQFQQIQQQLVGMVQQYAQTVAHTASSSVEVGDNNQNEEIERVTQ